MESPTVLSPRQAQRKWEDMLQRLEDANAALKRRPGCPGEGQEGLPDEEEVEKYIPKRTFHAFKSLKLRLAEIKAEKRRRKHQRLPTQQEQQQEQAQQPPQQQRASSSSEGDEDTDTDWSLSEGEEDESVYTPTGRRRRASVVKQQLEELLEQPIPRSSSSDAMAPGPVLLRATSGSFQPGSSLKRRDRLSTTSDAAGPSVTIRRSSDRASLDRQQASAVAAGGAGGAAAGALGSTRQFSRSNSNSARCPVLPALAEGAAQDLAAPAAAHGSGSSTSVPHKSHLAPTAAAAAGAGGTEPNSLLLRPEGSSVGSSLNSTAPSSSHSSNNSSLRKPSLEVPLDMSGTAGGLGATLGGTTAAAAAAAAAAAGAGSTFKRPPITGTYAARSFRGSTTKAAASSGGPPAEATLTPGHQGATAAAGGSSEAPADADWVAARLPPSRLPAAAGADGSSSSMSSRLEPAAAAAAHSSGQSQQAGLRRFGNNLSITLRPPANQEVGSSQQVATDTAAARSSPSGDVSSSSTRDAAAASGRACFTAAPLSLSSASGPSADRVEAAAAALYGGSSSRRDLSATASKRPPVDLSHLPTAATGSTEAQRAAAAAAAAGAAAAQSADKSGSSISTATLGFVATAAVGFGRKQRRDSVLLPGPASPLQRTTSSTAEEAGAGPDSQASPKPRPVSGWRARRLSGLCLEGPACPEPAAGAAAPAAAVTAGSGSSSNSSSIRVGWSLPPRLNVGGSSGAAAPGQLAAPGTAEAAAVDGGKVGSVGSTTSSKTLSANNPGSGATGHGLSGTSQKYLSGSGLISSVQLGGSGSASSNSNNLTIGSSRSRRAIEALSVSTGALSPCGDSQGSPSMKDSSAAIGCQHGSGLSIPASPGQPPLATDPVAAARRRRGSVLLSAPMSPRPMSPRPGTAGAAAAAAGAGSAGVDVNEVLSSIKQALNTMSLS